MAEYIVIRGEGEKVSREEAAEIIRRTDAFYEKLLSGNNHEFNRSLYRMSGLKADWEALSKDHSCCDMDYRYLPGNTFRERVDFYKEWKTKEWGCLDLHYFLNYWISCAYIGGPYGWINPEGEIGGLLYGEKYGIDEDKLEEDLEKVASEWPSLKFSVYLVNFSSDDRLFVYSEWKVREGRVEKIGEEYELDDIRYGSMDSELYEKHLREADFPECWWSLDELKKLWPGKLISGGLTEED